jgi:hypothetical protein
MEKFDTPETISSTGGFGSAAILQTLGVNYELQSLRPSHRRVSTCRLQNGQGQAGNLEWI